MTWSIRVFVCLVLAGLLAGASTIGAARPAARERVITGAEAREYVARLRASNQRFREVMAKAEADMRARGFKPAAEGVLVVERTTEPTLVARLLDRLSPTLSAQSVYQGEGRAIWSPWDDGDARTWEGNIFGESYTGGVYASANFQYSTDTGWTPLTYWSSQTGASGTPGVPTHWHGGACNGSNITDHALKHAMQNSWTSCATAAGLCKFTAIHYFNCLGTACLGSLVKGFLDDLLAWSRECKARCTWINTSAGVWQCI
jgi:hypothetical protein